MNSVDLNIPIQNALYAANMSGVSAFELIAHAFARPCVAFRPKFGVDGDQYFFLLGEDLQSGVAGFGKTPELAAQAFDDASWYGRDAHDGESNGE